MRRGLRFVVPPPTTLRRSTVAGALVLLAVGQAALANAPVSEVDLVQAALDGPSLQARTQAHQAAVAAARTVTPRTSNPSLDLRHEQANGPAGASTDVLAGSWTVGLGLPGLAEQTAARQRGEAAEAGVRATRLSTICTVRRDVLQLWMAVELSSIRSDAHQRLQHVAESIDALAGAGDLSGHDSARATLALLAHQSMVDEATATELTAAAKVEAWTGQSVRTVQLGELQALPPTAELVHQATDASPELVALQKARQAIEAERAVARRSAAPGLTLSGGGRRDAMPDGRGSAAGFEVGASLELPVFERNQAERAGLDAQLAAVDADIARLQASIGAEVTAAARRASELSRPAPPLDTAAIWQGALDRTLSGEASLESLLAVARDLEDAERSRIDAETRHRMARLSVSCAVGAFPDPHLQSLLLSSPSKGTP